MGRKCFLHKTVLLMGKICLTYEKGQDYSQFLEVHVSYRKRILTAGFKP